MNSDPLLVVTAAAVAGAAFCTAYAMAVAPSGEPVRLGLRGLKRRRSLAENTSWRLVEPLARWLGRRVRGLVSATQVQALDLQLERAGDMLGLVAEELVALAVLGGITGACVGFALLRLLHGNLLELAGCVAFGVSAPFMIVSSTTAERTLAVTRRLPGAIDLLALSMSAGLDFPSAVRQFVEKAGAGSDPLVEEFTLILMSLKIGRTRQHALEQFAHRVPCRAVVDFTGAVVQAELRGTPLARVLAIQAETSRVQRTVRAEEAASQAGVKLVIPLALAFLCVLLVIVAPMIIRLRAG